MTDRRTHPVADAQAHAAAVGTYKRDGYTIVDENGRETVLEYYSHGSLLAHLALFFTIGWLTLGILNLWYAWRTRRKTYDRVRVVVG